MSSRRHMAANQAIMWLVVTSVLPRAVFWLVYRCLPFPDTRTYLHHARSILHLYSTGFDGMRTPGFPLLIIACGFNDTVLWFVHTLMGIAIAFMLFYVALRETKSPFVALMVAVWYNFSLNMVAAEASVMTETLTTFLVAALIVLAIRIWDAPKPKVISFVVLGLITGYAFLVRPPIITVAPVYFVLFLIHRPAGARKLSLRIRNVAVYTLIVSAIVLWWCGLVWQRCGMFAPSTLMGYNLTQHTGGFMEHAPDKYATIRDIYLKCRARQIAGTGRFTNTIWQAHPYLMKATGLSYADLSKLLQKMCMQMIREHPLLYARSVCVAWVHTWDASRMYFIEGFKSRPVGKAFHLSLVAHRLIDVAVNFIFLVVSLTGLYVMVRRQKVGDWATRLLLMALVFVSSVVCAFSIYGDNGRYQLPFQPWAAYVVIVSIWYRYPAGRNVEKKHEAGRAAAEAMATAPRGN